MSESASIPSLPFGNEPDVWLLRRRHEDLSEMFRTCWELYIKFYTVFLTFTMAAMGLLLARDEKMLKLSDEVVHVLVFVFVGQSLLTATTSAFLALYSRKVAKDHASLERAMLRSLPTPPALLQTKTIPLGIATWAGWANAIAMVGMAYAWVHIATLYK